MKKFFLNCYIKFTTWRYLRKLKKFGYKFIFLFLFLFCFNKVFALSAFETDEGRFYGTYNNTPFDYGPHNYVVLFTNNLSFMPYYDNGGITQQVPLLSGEWEIRFYFVWTIKYSTPYVPSMYAGNVRATCDGTESFDVIDSFYNQQADNYTQVMMYRCSSLQVTQNFGNLHFDFVPISGTSNYILNFLIDTFKYGNYSSDPYDEVLSNIQGNTAVTNMILNQFQDQVGSWFDEFLGSDLDVSADVVASNNLRYQFQQMLNGFVINVNGTNYNAGCSDDNFSLLSGLGSFLTEFLTCQIVGSNTNSFLLTGVKDTMSSNFNTLITGINGIGLDIDDLLVGVGDTSDTLSDIKTLLLTGLSDSTQINKFIQNSTLGLEDTLLSYADYSDMDLKDKSFKSISE